MLKIYENIGYEIEFIGNDDDRKKIVEVWLVGFIVFSG